MSDVYVRAVFQYAILILLPAVIVGGVLGWLAFWVTVGVMVVVASAIALKTDLFM